MGEMNKRALEQLRHEVARASGRQLSQQEVLGMAIEFALRHLDEFLRETTWKPLTEAEIQKILAKAQPLGKWSVDDIDDIVYGDDA